VNPLDLCWCRVCFKTSTRRSEATKATIRAKRGASEAKRSLAQCGVYVTACVDSGCHSPVASL
jgi:hypothetical protein